MKELYFISLISNINIAAIIVFAFTIVALVFMGIKLIVLYDDDIGEESLAKVVHFTKKWVAMPCIISSILLILLPSKNDLYVIYGVGTTIDYIKSNPTARQLPDKVVNLLDKIVDNAIEEQKTNKPE